MTQSTAPRNHDIRCYDGFIHATIPQLMLDVERRHCHFNCQCWRDEYLKACRGMKKARLYELFCLDFLNSFVYQHAYHLMHDWDEIFGYVECHAHGSIFTNTIQRVASNHYEQYVDWDGLAPWWVCATEDLVLWLEERRRWGKSRREYWRLISKHLDWQITGPHSQTLRSRNVWLDPEYLDDYDH